VPGVWERLERDFVERLYYHSLKRFFLVSHCCFKGQSPELCLMGSCCYILGNLREFMAVSQLFCTIIPFSWALYPPSHCKLFHHHPSACCVSSNQGLWLVSVLNLLLHGDFIGFSLFIVLPFFIFYFMGQFLSTSSFPVNLSVSFYFFCLHSFFCCLHVSHFIYH